MRAVARARWRCAADGQVEELRLRDDAGRCDNDEDDDEDNVGDAGGGEDDWCKRACISPGSRGALGCVSQQVAASVAIAGGVARSSTA